jgi:hypothetical protein
MTSAERESIHEFIKTEMEQLHTDSDPSNEEGPRPKLGALLQTHWTARNKLLPLKPRPGYKQWKESGPQPSKQAIKCWPGALDGNLECPCHQRENYKNENVNTS